MTPQDKIDTVRRSVEEAAGPDWTTSVRATFGPNADELARIDIVATRPDAAPPPEPAPASDGPGPLLTHDEAAEALRVSPRTLDTVVAEGEIVPVRVRRRRLYTRAAIDDYIRRQSGRRPSSR